MPNNYGTIITTAGAALIANCILSGGKVNIKEAAAGDGGGTYYQPTVGQTTLRNEKWRGDIAHAEISTSTANMIDVKIVIDDSVGGFPVREIGLFDDDGTLVAICNTPDTEKVALSGGVSGKLTLVVHIVVADASVVSFTIMRKWMLLFLSTTHPALPILTSVCWRSIPCRPVMPTPKPKATRCALRPSTRTTPMMRPTLIFVSALPALTAA